MNRLVFFLGLGILGPWAQAQPPAMKHGATSLPPTARPTISPYLQLGRTDIGPLPAYQTFVQPQVEVLRQQQNQWSAIQRLEQAQRQRPAQTYRSTGRGGRFLDTLHFYPQR